MEYEQLTVVTCTVVPHSTARQVLQDAIRTLQRVSCPVAFPSVPCCTGDLLKITKADQPDLAAKWLRKGSELRLNAQARPLTQNDSNHPQ